MLFRNPSRRHQLNPSCPHALLTPHRTQNNAGGQDSSSEKLCQLCQYTIVSPHPLVHLFKVLINLHGTDNRLIAQQLSRTFLTTFFFLIGILTIFPFSVIKALLNVMLHKTISKQLSYLNLDFS